MGSHLQDLMIYKDTCVTVLVVVLLPLLLLLLLFQLPAPARTTTAAKPRSIFQFTLQQTRRVWGGPVEQFTVNMKEAKRLSTLKKTINAFKPAMAKFQQEHRAYKFQVAASIVFHKTVDRTVVTHPSVVLTSEMVAVYTNAAPPLIDVNRHLLSFIDVYEQNGSGWEFSNFVSLQLTLWHLDPLQASAFVPLPDWIQTRRDVGNVIGTGDDCLKWAVKAGMHPVGAHGERMSQYVEHISKYKFSSLHFPVPLSSVGSFASANNMSINVYSEDDDKKVIYPLPVSSTLVSDRHVDLLLFERDGIQRYTTIRNFTRLVRGQVSNHEHEVFLL